jgi:hypothetical protein
VPTNGGVWNPLNFKGIPEIHNLKLFESKYDMFAV